MDKQIKRHFDRAKILDSLRELDKNSRIPSKKTYTEAAKAIEFLTIQYNADRILKEIYG